MTKSIITIGIDVPGGQTKYTPLKSKLSLLDYDISVFNPDIGQFYGYYDEYLGKPCLDESYSFQLKEHLEHWRREILEAVKAGKTVFLLLNELEEVYVVTGKRSYSGTGRNRQTSRYVALHTNYALIPGGIEVLNSKGMSMKLHSKDNILAGYWSELGPVSEYRVLISGQGVKQLIVTKTGEKTVGACLRYKNASGTLVLLPYVELNREDFITYEKEDQIYWTDEAVRLGKKFVSGIVGVDKATREAGEITPAPGWMSQGKYVLPKEQKIRDTLLTLETKIESLHKEKEQRQQTLAEETVLKGLLYEKGKSLEAAILEALEVIGFNASQYQDSESEFDVVFESKEGRVIGEAEGKDNKLINIDKLRQLEMNIHEDFARKEVVKMAKGALIGNAYRLSAPDDRGAFFTTKCLIAAARSKTALIRTTDLFYVARYLSGKADKIFAKKCRQAILDAVGVVKFPEIPEGKTQKQEQVVVDKTE